MENDTENTRSLPESLSGRNRRLCKSRKEKMVDGVLGGIAEYFGVDPTLVRIAYLVLLVLYNPLGFVILYILLAIVMPECEETEEVAAQKRSFNLQESRVALVLLAIGVFLVVECTVPSHPVPNSLVGVLLIALAIYLLVRSEK